MAPETTHAIDKGNIYRDMNEGPVDYILIDGFYVDEAGMTQIKIRQYTDMPVDANNSAAYLDGVSGKRTLTVNDVRDRILKDELHLYGKN